jgi:hypothetical protein
MNESPGPHGFYDGPVKVLAARHLALIKAIFFLLLVSLPGVFLCVLADKSGYLRVKRNYPAVESSYLYPGRAAQVRDEAISPSSYDSSRDEIIGSYFLGFPVGPWYLRSHRELQIACGVLAFVFALLGGGMLLFRFYRLSKLLYPQLAFYFTLLVLVPFLNLIVIFLLLWSALRQMRARGLRVGIFGIDPARFG